MRPSLDPRPRLWTLALLALLGALGAASGARAEDGSPGPKAASASVSASASEGMILIELYTSQGCASCPPADALMVELRRLPGVVALSMPVDYWNYLGWRDTMGKLEFTRRQRAYATLKGTRTVYTPQIVVDGMADVIGSRRTEVLGAIDSRRSTRMGDVPIRIERDGARITAHVGEARRPGLALASVVWMVRFVDHVDVEIGRGENAGRKLRYWNVATGISQIGAWRGAAAAFTTLMEDSHPDEGIAILVQGDGYGPVLGAAALAPPPSIVGD